MMKVLVLTSVFPNAAQPGLGIFVRERMFMFARHCELKVVAPVPWFPLVHRFKKNYRPQVPYYELQQGVEVFHPKFFNIPKFFKFMDGFFFFLSSYGTLRRLRREFDFDIIDTHFAYPCGFGGVLLGMAFSRPVTVTVRGNERIYLEEPLIDKLTMFGLRRAAKVFAVCDDLRQLVLRHCGPRVQPTVVANGVDIAKFTRMDRKAARARLKLPQESRIILSAGGLTRWKGFHRIIRNLPALLDTFPDLLLVVVGGAPANDSFEAELRGLVEELGLRGHVLFAGAQPHGEMNSWMSAADIFCLATQGEGWANVFLEAMACGLPVVTTRVGGNPEVVASDEVGILFELESEEQLVASICEALEREWDREKIVAYAQANTWETRVQQLLQEYSAILGRPQGKNT